MRDPDYEDLLPLLSVPAARARPRPRRRHPPPLPPGARSPRPAPPRLSGTRWAKEAFALPDRRLATASS